MKPLTHFEFITTDRDRVCRICHEKIARNTFAIALKQVHVSPKIVDLHFHEGCFTRAFEHAKETRNHATK